MMLRRHQFVPSAEGDVAENVHVFVLYRVETRARATPLCRQIGPLLGRRVRGRGCELQASERRWSRQRMDARNPR